MALNPQQYAQLKAFRDLIATTMDRLGQAQSQAALSQTVGDIAPRWDDVDGDFANVLRDVGNSVWTMPFAQVRPTVSAIVGHLGQQLGEVDQELASG
ncbi:MAG: hypothetical protein CSA66_00025 [Proteobacteria bacterium]|nr:MAG: hypothetical protein CSA66_00025 [Pseudomonadota bacterium]